MYHENDIRHSTYTANNCNLRGNLTRYTGYLSEVKLWRFKTGAYVEKCSNNRSIVYVYHLIFNVVDQSERESWNLSLYNNDKFTHHWHRVMTVYYLFDKLS